MTDLKIGARAGSLTIIDDWESHKWRNTCRKQWLALCDCGQFRICNRRTFPEGRCVGCAYRSRAQSTNRISVWQRLFNLSLNRRGKDIQLTLKDFKEIVTKNCYYCDAPPRLRNPYGNNVFAIAQGVEANGLDRLDSAIGYLKSNVVPCCKTCNYMKSTLSLEDFKKHIITLYERFASKA